MTGNLLVAGFAGGFVPVLLERFRVDPAIASSIFVTTFTDVCGFLLLLGLVVFLAMLGNLVVAGFAGAFIPLVLERFGVDPAVASSIFVTTFTDVCGFLLLLGLAGWLLL
jgi:magnesium transporter